MSDPRVMIRSKDGKKKKCLSDLPTLSKENQADVKATTRERFGHGSDGINWRSTSPYQEASPTWRTLGRRSMPFVFSIAGAIVIGIILGFSVLALFSDNKQDSNINIDSHLSFPSHGLDHRAQGDKHRLMRKIPTLEVYVLQAGQFRSEKGAILKAKRLHELGIVAVISPSNPARVYTGIAMQPTQAKKRVSFYRQKGIKIYVNQWKLNGSKRQLNTHAVSAVDWTNQLFRRLASSESTAQTVSAQQNQVLLQRATQAYQLAAQQLTRQEREVMSRMIGSLRDALQTNHATQVQAGLVHYIMAYNQLLKI